MPNRPSRVRTVLRPARAYSTLLLHFKYFVFLSFVIPCMCADRLLRCAHLATSRSLGPIHSVHSWCLESLHRLLSFISTHLHKDEEEELAIALALQAMRTRRHSVDVTNLFGPISEPALFSEPPQQDRQTGGDRRRAGRDGQRARVSSMGTCARW